MKVKKLSKNGLRIYRFFKTENDLCRVYSGDELIGQDVISKTITDSDLQDRVIKNYSKHVETELTIRKRFDNELEQFLLEGGE